MEQGAGQVGWRAQGLVVSKVTCSTWHWGRQGAGQEGGVAVLVRKEVGPVLQRRG